MIKDFTDLKLDEFKLWCETNGVKYIVTDYYSDTVEEGKLYGQNYTETYLPEGEYLRINHSLGKVYVKDFTNQTKASMVDWLTDINDKAGNLKITFVGEYYSKIDKGKVADQDTMDSYVDIGSTIIVMYSLGDSY
jgi:beta-lactam-binding protein with PASTA domain